MLKKSLFLLVIAVLLGLPLLLVDAGDRVLSNNRGDESATWFITGEPTLVMNGFDLTPLNLPLPAVIDRVSLAVQTAVPGATVEVVVYQDANGGSPADAVLAGRTQVVINQPGVFTVTFPTPVSITQPVVWIGFYLPVDFVFLADKSGTSVLTYWAWTPGGRFDVANLASAQVLGPADGTAPVNINMGGIARITAEISSVVAGTPQTVTPGATPLPGTPGPVITQIIPVESVDLSVLGPYSPACETLYKDDEDIKITFRGELNIVCQAIWPGYAPPSPLGFSRKELLYDLMFFDANGVITGRLPEAVTHCIQANPVDIDMAVVGAAYGAPRRWELLPTLRVGNFICAEVWQGGNLSYFIPGVETPTPTPTTTPKP
ncbi:MAG: hypothetical protein BroJett038_11680 [Chloroflexota bacterium]|nr:MAG: hypothetical protein BroJett038_11680 [Chloroflexota bacterium]